MGFLKRLGKFAKKVVDFEKENLRHMGDTIKGDPERLLLGALDPFSTKVWNKALDKDWSPVVNQLGGATDEAYARAAAKGIDIGPGASMHQLAGTIAGMFGGQALAGLGSKALAGTKFGGLAQTIAPGEGGVAGLMPNSPMDLIKLATNGQGVLGALASANDSGPSAPVTNPDGTTTMPVLPPLARTRTAMPADLKSYGKSGGEHLFFGPAENEPVTPSGSQPPPGTESGSPPVPTGYVPRNPRHGMRWVGMNQGGGLRMSSPQFVSGHGSGRDDTVEALLSDGEYVIDAESVALLGDGSLDEGAARLDQLRQRLRQHKGKALAKGEFSPDAKDPMEYMGLAKGGNVSAALARIRKALQPMDYEARRELLEQQRRRSNVPTDVVMGELERLQPDSDALTQAKRKRILDTRRRRTDAEILEDSEMPAPIRRAKGGRTRYPAIGRFREKLGVDVTAEERRHELDTIRAFIRAHQKDRLPREGEDVGGDPYNRDASRVRKALGGPIDIKEARNRVTSIQSLAKSKPVKAKTKDDPVAELRQFADRLEAKLNTSELAAEAQGAQ